MTDTHASARTGMFRKDGGPEHVPDDGPGTIEGPTVATPVVDSDLERRVLADMQARQRERFGGGRIGAALFGWIVAVGMTALLTAVAGLIGATVFPEVTQQPVVDVQQVDGLGLWSAVAAVVVLALAYLAGGYVAGRMARFAGARNGVLVWVVGAVLTVIATVSAAVAGTQLGLAGQIVLPSGLPSDLGMITLGGVVALVVALLVTLLAAATGGRLGEQFHRRVDKAGISR